MDIIEYRRMLRGILSTHFEILKKEKTNHTDQEFKTLCEETKQMFLIRPEFYLNGINANEITKRVIEGLFDEFT